MLLLNERARKQKLYDGLCPIVPTLEAGLRSRPTFLVADMVGDDTHRTGELFDRLRRRYPVYGGSAICDALELDRAFGLAVAIECGLRVPDTVVFDSTSGRILDQLDLEDRQKIHRVKGHLKEARQFLHEAGGRWVLKPSRNLSTALTYVSSGPEDMISRLEEADAHREIARDNVFMLQRFVPGVEISTEAWVVEGELVTPMNSTLETKRFLAGDLGPSTGCQTSVVWCYEMPPVDWSAPEGKLMKVLPKLVRKTVGTPGMRQWLRRPEGPRGERYPPFHGPIDINCIVAEDPPHDPTYLEFCPRFGYSAVYALLELYEGDLHDLFRDAAEGRLTHMSVRPGYGYSVRVSIPPYPANDMLEDDPRALETLMRKATDIHIRGPVESDHVWLLDAQKDGDRIQSAGVDAVLMEITGRGRSIEDARDAAHELFEVLEVPNKQARVADGAARALRDIARLRSWGYEVGAESKPAEPSRTEAAPVAVAVLELAPSAPRPRAAPAGSARP
jgi:phosphoribosylamine-glycine ligase